MTIFSRALDLLEAIIPDDEASPINHIQVEVLSKGGVWFYNDHRRRFEYRNGIWRCHHRVRVNGVQVDREVSSPDKRDMLRTIQSQWASVLRIALITGYGMLKTNLYLKDGMGTPIEGSKNAVHSNIQRFAPTTLRHIGRGNVVTPARQWREVVDDLRAQPPSGSFRGGNLFQAARNHYQADRGEWDASAPKRLRQV
jgi:hypothetical protein